jgi:hypothetical protein
MRGQQRDTFWAAIVGAAAVIAYAVLAAIDIIVWAPMAAAPGLPLEQIRAEVTASQGSTGDAFLLTVLGAGVVLAVAAAVLAIRLRWRPGITAVVFLVLLMLGAPALFVGSFGAGMNLADTYYTVGGVGMPGVVVFYLISALAVPAAAVVALLMALRSRPRMTVIPAS